MAESNLAETAGEIKAILDVLHQDAEGRTSQSVSHVELVDFDRLIKLMHDVQEFLGAEVRAAAELERVKLWMGNIIRGRIKALSFLKNKIRGNFSESSLEKLAAPELILQFEETGRALNAATAGNTSRFLASQSDASKYDSYKS